MNSPTPPDNELREQIHDIIGRTNRNYDKTGFYNAERMLDSIMELLSTAISKAEERGRIDEIKNLVVASGLYDIDRAYSRNQFYVVDKPDVDQRLADLNRKAEQ